MTAPWEGVSWTKAPAYSIVKDNNTPVSSIDHLWDVFDRQFNFSQASPVDWDFINSIPAQEEHTFLPISIYEVKTTLQTTINTSAPSTDHVTWRHLKILLSNYKVAAAVTTLYNCIIDEGIWPTPLKESLSIIIPKPGKSDYSTPKAYHPTVLLSVLGKLLTKILAKQLQYKAIAFNLLYPSQFGGIQKHTTTDVGLILTDIIVKARERGLFTSVLALDITQFFPSLNHSAMAHILTKLGFNQKIVRFAASFFTNQTTCFKWGSAESSDIPCSQGTPQGDCLSPILSTLYLAPILHIFSPWDIEKPLNTLITSSDSIETNVSHLSSEYTSLIALLSKLGLHTEHSKLELMHFMTFDIDLPQHKFKEANPLPLIIHHRGSELCIEAKEVWRYLGFFFDPHLSFNHHIQQYTNKAFSALRACQMLGNSCGGLKPQQCILIYNSCIKPILAYGLALWYSEWGLSVRSKVKRLEKVQNFAIHWITGGFWTTPISTMELLSGIPPVVVWCNLALTKYTACIASLPENHLLKIVYHYDPLPSCYWHLPHKQRRSNLPDDNPVTRLKTDCIHEHFNPYHEEAHPGSHVLDLYLEHITFWHMDTPKKSDDSFKVWLKEYKQWLASEMESRELVIFTDGAFWAKSKRGAVAIVIWKNGEWLEE